ncbi:MAG: NADH:flavin oxidoreductase [Acidimicrobiales bacterium]|jgi:2,4-dienoyl-CoA reductase-like NADH-dependent reductase (Old Yellow Enzyme family)
MTTRLTQVRRLATYEVFVAHLSSIGTTIPVDRAVESDGPLARPLDVAETGNLSNRWAILPMEGWDGTSDGRPTDLVLRRWRRFGGSGASLVWGGEAFAVVPEGRANPRQLCMGPSSVADLEVLRTAVEEGRRASTGSADGLVLGLQLTHSGRWSRPNGSPEPLIAYRHPVLDARVGAKDDHLLTDGQLDDLVGAFVAAARAAHEAGFSFVDVKQCHGYLGHELLSAMDRPGPYGGGLTGRSRFVTSVVSAIRQELPDLGIGTRLSVVDSAPYVAGPDGVGTPDPLVTVPYLYAFGGDGTGSGFDLTEPHALLDQLEALGVGMVCVTAGSPYANPHTQRPAYFPPSDGYQPPRDPLIDVANLLEVTRQVTQGHPGMTVVGSGMTYLQEWLPHVAQAMVREGWCDVAGIGRMALSYPTLPLDVLQGRGLTRPSLCRTFSDCTTAPRNGLVSGCYPIDEAYKLTPQRVELARVKREAEQARKAVRS